MPSKRVTRSLTILLTTTAVLSTVAVAQPRPAGGAEESAPKSIAEITRGAERAEGFVPFFWHPERGRLWLELADFDRELLYVSSLAAGIGSNDIGLDRGQLGGTHVVEFRRVGPRVLMVERNYGYRALSDNPDEVRAVQEAFAESVLWGFEVAAEEDGRVLVDATDFVLRDAHGVAATLKRTGQGSYKLEPSRSVVYPPRTRAFPRNTELEGTLTFVGEPEGAWIRSVTPTPEAVTVRQHHSFIQLPDDAYRPRRWDPRSGFIPVTFHDYATPIDQPLEKRLVMRHRLEKRDPSAAVSEPVEPIVYYLDRGAPEPIRSALLDGARWWNQAFEAAGYVDAFRVELMPEGADPLDVRYNVIQWVHRSTRGWSYGSSVVDPRTGEILKGHVTLGSLRVRQDFLIAEGLLAPYGDDGGSSDAMREMALARLRQLSAHEVGHTLGLMHSYASSSDQRASVMDYPHPLVTTTADGELDLSDAYGVGIGEWDARAILWGYQHFPSGTDEAAALDAILRETIAQGLEFVTDQDARPPGGAHPRAHLWDSGEDAVAELRRLMEVRQAALARFGARNVPFGEPLSSLEDALVPIYLLHRYQLEAAVKLVGGVDYSYAVRGDDQTPVTPVPGERQRDALEALLETLAPSALTLPERLLLEIPPPAAGLGRGREHFPSRTGVTFDPLSAAEVAAEMTVGLLLHPARATRLVVNHAVDPSQPGLDEVLERLLEVTWLAEPPAGLAGEVKRVIDDVVLDGLQRLALSPEASGQAQALTLAALSDALEALEEEVEDGAEAAHRERLSWQVDRFLDDPEEVELPAPPRIPDGPPIGSAQAACGWPL